eukprot:TRINITY_DN67323_c4_g1_i2.p1 TRINITY_DN67323_c4_g1~~TRINITY_DN67323_c4_g1_i2.p1  ORF type:complete len:455 (+),score=74.52 TRINITY_DN67323_c4_g1_i2:125-1489(+)
MASSSSSSSSHHHDHDDADPSSSSNNYDDDSDEEEEDDDDPDNHRRHHGNRSTRDLLADITRLQTENMELSNKAKQLMEDLEDRDAYCEEELSVRDNNISSLAMEIEQLKKNVHVLTKQNSDLDRKIQLLPTKEQYRLSKKAVALLRHSGIICKEFEEERDAIMESGSEDEDATCPVERSMALRNKQLITANESLTAETVKCAQELRELREQLVECSKQKSSLSSQVNTLTEQLQSTKEEERIKQALEKDEVLKKWDLTSVVGPTAAPEGEGSETGNDKNSKLVMKALTVQREKYKQMVASLERDKQHLLAQVTACLNEKNQLESENVELYATVKFHESNNGASAYKLATGGAPNLPRPSTAPTTKQRDVRVDLGRKYERLFEDSINPFQDWKRRQRDDKLKRLTPVDKFTLRASSFFLSTKFSRLFLVIYSAALHIFVFAVLYQRAHLSLPHH